VVNAKALCMRGVSVHVCACVCVCVCVCAYEVCVCVYECEDLRCRDTVKLEEQHKYTHTAHTLTLTHTHTHTHTQPPDLRHGLLPRVLPTRSHSANAHSVVRIAQAQHVPILSVHARHDDGQIVGLRPRVHKVDTLCV